MIKEIAGIGLYVVIIILILIKLTQYRPYIDETSAGDIVIWFNWKNKRIYKYLYKNKNG